LLPKPGVSIDEFIGTTLQTLWHPVDTTRMGSDDQAPVSPDLTVKGIERLHVAGV
jgi:choline dehydrogenase-like flavoprotein